MPESNATELKKFDFSKFIVKFQKIISLVFTVIMIDLEGAGIKRPPIWLGMHLRGYGWYRVKKCLMTKYLPFNWYPLGHLSTNLVLEFGNLQILSDSLIHLT